LFNQLILLLWILPSIIWNIIGGFLFAAVLFALWQDAKN
jgi:ABC-type multidrug transport system permease subunit